MSQHHFIQLENGKVYGLGCNFSGELGNGGKCFEDVPTEIDFFYDNNVEHITTGFGFKDGCLYSCGSPEDAQLGYEEAFEVYHPQKIRFFVGKKVTKVYSKWSSTFVITDDKRMFAFGNNDDGNFGNGESEESNLPTEIDFFRGKEIKDIQLGFGFTFVILSNFDPSYSLENNEIYSFGSNEHGQLGLRSTEDSYEPIEFTYFEKNPVQQLQCGDEHVLILDSNGKLYGIGHYMIQKSSIPCEIEFFNDKEIDKIFAGNEESFVMTKNGDIYAFGMNLNGELGLGHNNPVMNPVKLEYQFSFLIETIFIKNDFTLFLSKNGTLYSCGSNTDGCLGIGGFESQFSPVKITLEKNLKVKSIFYAQGEYLNHFKYLENCKKLSTVSFHFY